MPSQFDDSTVDEPIAVIGMSCRFPGAPDPERFWNLLRHGEEAVATAPEDRWPDCSEYRRGGFLPDVAGFDAGFFSISPNEAAVMDPQQRLMLELAWEALERARIAPSSVRGAATGVYVGAIGSDYATLCARQDADELDAHSFTGAHRSMIANRVSYLFGMRGPSMTVDAGQSSSLLAVQLACDELRRGEIGMALAGGVNLNLLPETSTAIGRFGALSPDGRCYTFDSRANGYVRGEGGGAVLLKPLSAALADGDQVHCVILGGATNNGCAERDGLTLPSRGAQEEVIRLACRRAGVRGDDVRYVELHGTGTPAGDPVEAAALGATLGAGRPAEAPLLVGSVKTNIGHLEGAAGVAGLVKLVLSIRHRILVPSLNFDEPNPDIPLGALNLRVQRESTDWPAGRLVAGVSSFGIGGTNCHLVLAEPPATTTSPEAAGQHAENQEHGEDDDAATPLVLSARSGAALRAQAAALSRHLAEHPSERIADVALSLLRTRSRFEHRAVLTGPDHRGTLDALAAGRAHGAVTMGRTVPGSRVLVFPGQGSQWVGMAADLLDEPVFAERIAECADALAPHTDYSLLDVLRAEPAAPGLDRVDVVQPALWAVMVSLAELWRGHGFEPDAVIGHSQGEIAAAAVTGALSLADAARVVALRSRAITRLSGGGMMSIEAPEQAVTGRLPDEVTVAALNGPLATVVSGPLAALERLRDELVGEYRCKILPVDYASHSAAVDVLREELRETLAPIRPVSTGTLFVSTVTGEPMDTAGLDADYWFRSLRHPVRFAASTRRALEHGCGLFVECSPHPVLVGSIEAVADDAGRDVAVTGTLYRDEPGPACMLRSLGEAFAGGAEIDWGRYCTTPGARIVDLPTYPFQRERHWVTLTPGTAPAPGVAPAEAPVLDTPPVADPSELVVDTTAGVLGYADGESIDPLLTFKDLGVDSVGAVELRNRLKALTGQRLPTTVLFDFPTPARLAEHLRQQAAGAPAETARPAPARTGSAATEPIAIVSVGCRYPGGIDTPEEFWRLLAEERDAITGLPDNRGWKLDVLLDEGADPHSRAALHGGFLHDADTFDAGFFGLSPREALAMDPQQRLLLETSWEAVERAGIDPAGLAGSATGVFVGAMTGDYGPRMHDPSGGASGHLLTGTTLSVASGRIAYTFGLNGPAITVDTACSSSLVAIQLATESLRRGECSLALAGGVTLMSNPGNLVEFSRQNGLAQDGRAKAFSSAADGTAFGEGAGVLVLERLSDARRNGHPVHAVIRGVAVNSDGASNGLTAPNGQAQQQVIRAALADARLEPGDVDVVEAHGTGTGLGDPIEAHAIQATYGDGRPQDAPLLLGSVKSNIGHAQAAAGVAGVIKMVLAMRHEMLPRTLHAEEPTDKVDWDGGGVRLLTARSAWPATGDRPRRAAVSSFGISGTNAHVVLEAAPPQPRPNAEDGTAGHRLVWVFSARSAESLRGQARRLLAYATPEDTTTDDLAATGRTLAARPSFAHRAVVVAGDRDELCAGLLALADGGTHPALTTGVAHTPASPVFVFPGQGAQWAGMALDLLATNETFAARLRECDEALAAYTGWSVEEVLRTQDTDATLTDSAVIQPVLFAVNISLAELWRSVGVRPSAVVGHSQGEIAAACFAGALSLPEAAKVVALRGQLLATLDGTGAMIAVTLPVAEVRELLEPWQDRLWVAVDNGPSSTLIAGDPDAITEFVAAHEDTLQMRRSRVDYAAHTPHVRELHEALVGRLGELSPADTDVAICSSTDGDFIDGAVLDTAYWYRNLAEEVRFDTAIRAFADYPAPVFIEMSPHPVLTGPTADILDEANIDGRTVGSLRRAEGDLRRFARSLAQAYVAGADVDFSHVLPAADGYVEPPTYAFDRQRYWLEPAGRAHPLLEDIVPMADGGAVLGGRLSRNSATWIVDHAVHEEVLLPGTAFVELMLTAANAVGADGVTELTLEAPLVLPAGVGTRVQLIVAPLDERGQRSVTVHSRGDGEDGWVRHASGVLGTGAPVAEGLAAWPPPGTPIELDDAYRTLAERGYHYGPAFQGLVAAWRDGADRYAELRLPTHPDRFAVHPALLDAALHLPVLDAATAEELLVPYSFAGVTLAATGADTLRVRLRESPEGFSVTASDGAGRWVGGIDELVLRPMSGVGGPKSELRGVDWLPIQLGVPAEVAERTWAVLDNDPRATGIAEAVRQAGISVVTCYEPGSIADRASVALVPCLPDPAVDTEDAEDLCEAARELLAEVLDTIQQALSNDRLAETRLVFVVDSSSLISAPVVGLVRSACAEHPGRFAVADVAPDAESWTLLAAALDAEETHCVVRDGQVLAPRVVRRDSAPAQPVDFGDGPVLVTGGTGAIGSLVATRLVAEHGVRDLVLVSRSGADAPGAADLVRRLTGLGASVTVERCDVTDREALNRLLVARPPTAVLHTAGVLDDTTVEGLSPDQLDTVLAPKMDAASLLHELTAELPLRAFVLFSSVAGLFGNAGQGNYAAANTFLDLLAEHRRAQGLPAVSIAWGVWSTGLAGSLPAASVARLASSGVLSLSEERGMDLFDAVLREDRSGVVVAAEWDTAALRAAGAALPAVLRGTVHTPSAPVTRPAAEPAATTAGEVSGGETSRVAARLAGVAHRDAGKVLLDVVRAEVAGALGHTSSGTIDVDKPFSEMGFDSLTSVELRNRLGAETGLRLPATLVFNQPTVSGLAGYLLDELVPAPPSPEQILQQALDQVAEQLGRPDTEPGEQERVTALLNAAAHRLGGDSTAATGFGTASDEEIFDFIDGL